MKYRFLVSAILLYCLITTKSLGQTSCKCVPPVKNTVWYSTYGYNKDYLSPSTIHFTDKGEKKYDFELQKVKAHDAPRFKDIFHSPISVPQYSYRLGYYNYKWKMGLEINFDHTKYIMYDNQFVRLKGEIEGTYFDTDTLVTRNFVRFEHTNGANFLLFNAVKRVCILNSANQHHRLSIVGKSGIGMVIPKTQVALWDEELDNKFHIAGYILGAEAGLHYELFKYVVIEPVIKGSFANYTNVLTVGSGKAHHHFFTMELILTAGISIPF